MANEHLVPGKSSTQTPLAAGDGLDRWREKAKRMSRDEVFILIGREWWPNGMDPGPILRDRAMANLVRDVGRRYENATMEGFVVSDSKQQRATELVRGHLNRLDKHVAAGEGLIFYGPCGTGKDHLAVAAGRIAIDKGHTVSWKSAQTIFSDFRDSFSDDSGESEADLLRKLIQPDILIVSDPVPSHGELSCFQGNVLYRLLNERYGSMKSTWTTLNVVDVAEAQHRVGPATIDRLTHGATVVYCSWPTHRKALV